MSFNSVKSEHEQSNSDNKFDKFYDIFSSIERIKNLINNEINVNSLKSDVICSQSICKVKTHSIESFECNEEITENNKLLKQQKPNIRGQGRPEGSVAKQFKCSSPECGYTSKNRSDFNSHILIHSNLNSKSTQSLPGNEEITENNKLSEKQNPNGGGERTLLTWTWI